MARDVKALESGMRKLQQSCAELGSQKYFDEFLQIIHPLVGRRCRMSSLSAR